MEKIEEPHDELLDELKFELRKPIKHGDQEITMLELREPNANEWERFMKLAPTNPAGALLALISNITAYPPPVVGKIGARDINSIGEYLLAFFNTGQQTQKT